MLQLPRYSQLLSFVSSTSPYVRGLPVADTQQYLYHNNVLMRTSQIARVAISVMGYQVSGGTIFPRIWSSLVAVSLYLYETSRTS